MSFFPKFDRWQRGRKLRKLIEAEAPDLSQYVGRKLKFKDHKGVEKLITIKKIIGNKIRPHFYEINGKYTMNMLRFHAKMEGATDITEQQFKDFEEIEWQAVKNSAHDQLVSKLEKNGIIF